MANKSKQIFNNKWGVYGFSVSTTFMKGSFQASSRGKQDFWSCRVGGRAYPLPFRTRAGAGWLACCLCSYYHYFSYGVPPSSSLTLCYDASIYSLASVIYDKQRVALNRTNVKTQFHDVTILQKRGHIYFRGI